MQNKNENSKLHRIEISKSKNFVELFIDGKQIEVFEIEIEQYPDSIPTIMIKAPFEIKKETNK